MEGGEEKREEKLEIEALKGKQKELSDQITELEQALEAEKTAHFEAEKEMAGVSEKNYVLESKLKSTEEQFEASEGKVSELQTELEKLRRLSRYADAEDGAERSEEYQLSCPYLMALIQKGLLAYGIGVLFRGIRIHIKIISICNTIAV